MASVWIRRGSELPPQIIDIVLYGTNGERFPVVMPEGSRSKDHTGMLMRFDGVINNIERRYKHYRQEQTTHTEMEHVPAKGDGRASLPRLRRHQAQAAAPADLAQRYKHLGSLAR